MSEHTQALLDDFRRIVDSEELFTDPIKDHLAQYLLIVTCRGYENSVKQVLEAKIGQIEQQDLRNFASSFIVRVSIRLDKLRELLNKFDARLCGELDKLIRPEESTQYGTVITNRDSASHGKPIDLTYDEVIGLISISDKVIGSVLSLLK